MPAVDAIVNSSVDATAAVTVYVVEGESWAAK
jgi:hypothetical protein